MNNVNIDITYLYGVPVYLCRYFCSLLSSIIHIVMHEVDLFCWGV